MMIAILGRQPRIGCAELESVYPDAAVRPIGEYAALLNTDTVDGKRLGGTLKLAKPLIELPTTAWPQLISYVAKNLPEHLAYLPSGKLKLALGVYGLRVSTPELFRAGLELKKVCRAQGRSVRIVPPAQDAQAPSSAQTLHNQLTGPLGMELLLIKNGATTWLAQTTWVQDIDDYSRRDYGRPKRDAFVGMLPPKLAQVMVNLAATNTNPHHGGVLLDPFCGTGVVLQEAALMGFDVYGTDIEPKMIDYTKQNLVWSLKNDHIGTGPDNQHYCKLEAGDATSHTWTPKPYLVASEIYLGQPLSGLPSPQKLDKIISNCDIITRKFLQNLRPQLTPGTRICLALPAWRVGQAFKRLPMLDHLEDLGYNRVRFTQVSDANDLIYHREDQIVARDLLVITVK